MLLKGVRCTNQSKSWNHKKSAQDKLNSMHTHVSTGTIA